MKTYLVLAFSPPGGNDKNAGGSMEDWEAWMKENAKNVEDMGAPLANGVEGSGDSGFNVIKQDQWPAEGYMMIKAESTEQAQEVMKTSPLGSKMPLRIFEKTEM